MVDIIIENLEDILKPIGLIPEHNSPIRVIKNSENKLCHIPTHYCYKIEFHDIKFNIYQDKSYIQMFEYIHYYNNSEIHRIYDKLSFKNIIKLDKNNSELKKIIRTFKLNQII